jgi:hypothetical protein
VSALVRSPFPPRSPMRATASASAFSPVGALSPRATRRQVGGARTSPDSARAAASLEPRVLMWDRREVAAEEKTVVDTVPAFLHVASTAAAFDAGVFVCPEGAASAGEEPALLPAVESQSARATQFQAASSQSDPMAGVPPALGEEQIVVAGVEGVGDDVGNRPGADDWLINSARQRVLINQQQQQQQLDRTLSTVAAVPSSQPKSFIQVHPIHITSSPSPLLPSTLSAFPPSLFLIYPKPLLSLFPHSFSPANSIKNNFPPETIPARAAPALGPAISSCPF